ncbi:MAG: hypothetical protein FWH55_12595 [Oscillospiraceae bacterium]|nr:hypothetical protein [Oscillospiraceae bacterium]
MSKYQDRKGKTYTTKGTPLDTGGEGAIYALSGKSNLVAKIYAVHARTEARHRKLLAMLNTPMPTSALKQVAWPQDILFKDGEFCGFVMPFIPNGRYLNELYCISGEYEHLRWQERILIAKNLCAAISEVHRAGQVCGDLNPKNISVHGDNAFVTLLDTDSYHIEDSYGIVYRCEVGLPEYLPIEILKKMDQGQTLNTAPLPTFTIESDCFALAIHIFALLMNGCHPFSSAIRIDEGTFGSVAQLRIGTDGKGKAKPKNSVSNPQPIENIISGNSPFFQNTPLLRIPLYSPPLTILPDKMQALFRRAFVEGHSNPSSRPTSTEWFSALSKMEKDLTTCDRNERHQYSTELIECPWCRLETQLAKYEQREPPPVQRLQDLRNNGNTLHEHDVKTGSFTEQSAVAGESEWGNAHNLINLQKKGLFSPTFIKTSLCSLLGVPLLGYAAVIIATLFKVPGYVQMGLIFLVAIQIYCWFHVYRKERTTEQPKQIINDIVRDRTIEGIVSDNRNDKLLADLCVPLGAQIFKRKDDTSS